MRKERFSSSCSFLALVAKLASRRRELLLLPQQQLPWPSSPSRAKQKKTEKMKLSDHKASQSCYVPSGYVTRIPGTYNRRIVVFFPNVDPFVLPCRSGTCFLLPGMIYPTRLKVSFCYPLINLPYPTRVPVFPPTRWPPYPTLSGCWFFPLSVDYPNIPFSTRTVAFSATQFITLP